MSRAAQKSRMDAYAAKAALDEAWNRQSKPVRESTPTFTMDRQVAAARAEMGEARWAELNAEWEPKP